MSDLLWFRLTLALGSFFGMTGVLLGAFGAHGLRGKVEGRWLEAFVTATRYQLFHALLLVALAWLLFVSTSALLRASAILATLGILLFSGSLYLLVLLRWPVGWITPLGGLAFAASWLLLLIAAFSLTPNLPR